MWLWSPMQAVQTRPHTVHVRLMVAGADGCCDWSAFFSSDFLGSATRSVSNALDPSCTELLHCILSWAVDSHLSVSMLQTDRKHAFSVFRWNVSPPPPWILRRAGHLANAEFSIRRTWPVHLSWALMTDASMLVVCALFRTSVFRIISCHLIRRMLRRCRVWKDSSFLMCLNVSQLYRSAVRSSAW